MIPKCPGSAAFMGSPTITIKVCPECGEEIELFSCDPCATCKCGFIIYGNIQSCIKWCAYARLCVGDEIYEKFIAQKMNT